MSNHVTLDHIDNISTVADKHINELNVLRSLCLGIYNLAEFARKREIKALESQDKATQTAILQVTDETLFLGCVFDWFAVSLISYLRLVRLIHLMDSNSWTIENITTSKHGQTVRDSCVEYVQSVAPNVYAWRNKIAAHRAATDPRDDSFTLLTYSTMPTVDYSTPYYGVLNFSLGMSGGGPLGLEHWALTETFEALAPRLWPELKLTPFPPEWECTPTQE